MKKNNLPDLIREYEKRLEGTKIILQETNEENFELFEAEQFLLEEFIERLKGLEV